MVEDEPYMADAIRDGLRLEAIAADVALDGSTALELLRVNAYDIAVLDRDIPGSTGDEIAERIVASGGGMPILMLTAADRIDDILHYVVVHELCHLREPSHQKAFWRLLGSVRPGWQRELRWLREHGQELHDYRPEVPVDP